MSLHATLVGPGRPNVAFLHGLFGQGRNWNSIAKAIEPQATSVLFDLPDHGHSPHTDSFSYPAMADLVARDLEARLGSRAGLTIVGHSMGGKVAMFLAMRRPDLVKGLVIIDIAPGTSGAGSSFDVYIDALESIDLARVTSRAQAETSIADRVPDERVRQFLMQNLRRKGDGWGWQMNLPLLGRSLPEIWGWPAESEGVYDGPALCIRGAESGYVRDADLPHLRALFPRLVVETVPGAGHWVHTDAPDHLSALLSDFLVANALDRSL